MFNTDAQKEIIEASSRNIMVEFAKKLSNCRIFTGWSRNFEDCAKQGLLDLLAKEVKELTTPAAASPPELKGYNGYSNFETWSVSNWIQNDEEFHKEICQAANSLVDVASSQRIVRALVEDVAYEHVGQGTLAFEMVKGHLSSVNWRELTSIFES
jgi:hypothetical protein